MALGPEEIQYFRTQRRRVDDTYNIGQAQTEYQRQVAGSGFARNQGNVLRQFSRMREQLPYAFARRGLANSGIYQRGLTNHLMDKNQAIGDLFGAYQEQVGGLDLAQRQLGQVRTGALMDLDEQERTRIAAVAAALRAAQ